MSSLREKEPEDGDYAPVVEVVEMRDSEIQQQNENEVAKGLGFKKSQLGRLKTQTLMQYDKGERARKVSKYQSKKKVGPSSSSWETRSQTKIRAEDLKQETTSPTDHMPESSSLHSSLLNEAVQNPSETGTEHATDGTQSSCCSSELLYRDVTSIELDLSHADQSPEELYLSGEGEICTEQSPESEEEDDIIFAEESQDTRPRSQNAEYEDVSDETSSEDSMSVDHDDKTMQKSVKSLLKRRVRKATLEAPLMKGNLEWKQKDEAWSTCLAEESSPVTLTSGLMPSSDSTKPAGMPQTDSVTPSNACSKSRISESSKESKKFDSSSSSAAQSSSQKMKPPARNKISNEIQTKPMTKTPANMNVKESAISPEQSPSSHADVKMPVKTLSQKLPSGQVPMTKPTPVTVTNTKTPLTNPAAKHKDDTKQLPLKLNRKPPVSSASGSSEVGSKRTPTAAFSPRKGNSKQSGGDRSPCYSGSQTADSSGTVTARSFSPKELAEVEPSAEEVSPFFPSQFKRFSHSSPSLSTQLDGRLMERTILPSIQTAGHLGLSSHSGTEWNVEEITDMDIDEDDEDADVLSLYEYDTFLECEEEQGERGQGASLSKRPASGSVIKAKGGDIGEGSLHLVQEENLSISVSLSDKSERRVSRPGSKERNENEKKVEVLKDTKERGDAKVDNREKSPQSSWKPQGRETPSSASTSSRDAQRLDDDKFQKPKLPAPKSARVFSQSEGDRIVNKSDFKSGPRPMNTSSSGKPASVTGRGQGGWKDNQRGLLLPQPRSGPGRGRPGFRMPQTAQSAGAVPMRQPHHQEEIRKELEDELKHFLEKKSILEATETVGKIHGHEPMKIDRVLVLNLLHLFIREGAVPQLMRIFTFVCNQGLFNSEVCNAYIRLGCAESSRYSRQLKNIFQYLRRHGIQPAGDCIIALLRLSSEDKGDPMMFWLMLSYFETFPGFTLPLPMLEQAIGELLQHRDRDAISKFNQWVLTTKMEGVLQKLDLALVGQMTVSLLPASLSRLQKIIADTQDDPGDEGKEDFLPPMDTALILPDKFTDQDHVFFANRIKKCGIHEDIDGLAQVYVVLGRSQGVNRCLLKDYAQVLLQKAVVTSMDRFLHQLYNIVQRERSQGTHVEPDELALAHLAALVLERVYFQHHAEMTLSLFEVITQCPLVVKKLLVNCGDIGYKMVAVCLKCQRPLQALDLLKVIQLRKEDEQGAPLVEDVMRQLVAARDIPSAFSALKTVSSREAMGLADVGILSSQLMWHSLNVGNIRVAVDLLDLGQGPASLPPALLRALLVAFVHSGYGEKADALFQELKRCRVYNAEALGDSPCVFQLSTMLTPAEIRFCVLDRLKELHHKLCMGKGPGGRLGGGLERGVAVQVVCEHDPQLLALPFLALAPRSLPQAVAVVAQELAGLSPPLLATFSEQVSLLMMEPVSLAAHLNSYRSPGWKQELTREGEPDQTSPPAVQRPHAPPSSYKTRGGGGGGRQSSKPPGVARCKPQGSARGQSSVSQAAACPSPKPSGRGKILPGSKAGLLPLLKPVDLAERHFPVPQTVKHPAPGSLDSVRTHVPALSNTARPRPQQAESAASPLMESPDMMFPLYRPSEPVAMPLPEMPDSVRPPYQPVASVGRQVPRPPDVRHPPYQPVSSVGRQFSEAPDVSHSRYQPAGSAGNQARVRSPPQQVAGAFGRQQSVPSPARSQPSGQPGRVMKRRLSSPPEQLQQQPPPAMTHNPHKKPLLPTPSFPPAQQSASSPMELSEGVPPKKVITSLPGELFVGGRKSFPESRPAQQPSPAPAPRGPQNLVPGDAEPSQHSSRGRGMGQRVNRYRDHGQFTEPSAQATEDQSRYSSRYRGHTPSQSTWRGGHSSHQTSRGNSRPGQQFPRETPAFSSGIQPPFTTEEGYLPAQSSQSSQHLLLHASEEVDQLFPEGHEPVGRPGSGEHFHGELERFPPRQSTQHRNRQLSQQNIGHIVQPFSDETGRQPPFPSRVREQELNLSAEMGSGGGMMTQQEEEIMDHSLQGTAIGHRQQQLRRESWSSAPLYDQREHLSWRNQPQNNPRGLSQTGQASDPFSRSESPPGSLGYTDGVGMPVKHQGPIRGLRGRGRRPFGAGYRGMKSFSQRGGFR